MNIDDVIDQLTIEEPSKIVFLIMDGLGGMQFPGKQGTELEAAHTPNLDALAREGTTGMIVPVSYGITPGSGPAHFALFGYDPLEANIGRGVLEAAGIGFPLTDRDVAVRGNFVTLDADGNIVDRRAGRIASELSTQVCERLQRDISRIDDIEVIIRPVKEHRFLLVLRGRGLSGEIADTDPQETGVPPLEPRPLTPEAAHTAEVVKTFVERARQVLKDEKQANGVTLRGFAKHRPYKSMLERFKLRSLAIANYPMYRGVAFLIGMDLNPITADVPTQFDALEESWDKYDFFFLHVKYTDARGEDGDFDAKVKVIEEVDALVPRITALKPEVLVVTGDHSTPAAMRSHSWHPVPVLLHAATCRRDGSEAFGESTCLRGGLGIFPSRHLMALALAHAGRLKKFGA
jgi:2,3-bisphosphoglycerate-independent phosphoglycerate mutase